VIQERDESLGERRQQLRVLNKSGRSMYFASETSVEHREQISHDLTVVNERWNSVRASLTFSFFQLLWCWLMGLFTKCFRSSRQMRITEKLYECVHELEYNDMGMTNSAG